MGLFLKRLFIFCGVYGVLFANEIFSYSLKDLLDSGSLQERQIGRLVLDYSKRQSEDRFAVFMAESSRDPDSYRIFLPLNDRVLRFVDNYSQEPARTRLKKALARMKFYQPFIEEYSRIYEIPKDIAYLGIIESGFYSGAVSRKGAVGIWQFMKKTAKLCGLTVNRKEDERRDARKSTEAAFRHLRFLARKFKRNWPLVLAAYNSGDGYMSSQIRKHKSRDFWEISKKKGFKKETFHYVPKFYAALYHIREITDEARTVPEPHWLAARINP